MVIGGEQYAGFRQVWRRFGSGIGLGQGPATARPQLAAMLKAMADSQAGGTPLASSRVWRLPSGPGPAKPDVLRTRQRLTSCSPAALRVLAA